MERSHDGADELIRIESIRSIAPAEKIRPMRSGTDNPLLEIVLHSGDDYVLEAFREYLRELDVAVNLDRRIQVQSLCFVPVKVPTALHEEMAKFFISARCSRDAVASAASAGTVVRSHPVVDNDVL